MDLDLVRPWLQWGAAVSLLMAVIWIIRSRSAGVRGYVMGGAFVCLAALFLGLASQWPIWGMATIGVLLFVLLFADLSLRAAELAATRDAAAKEREGKTP